MYVLLHSSIPENIVRFIAPLALLIVGIIIEKYYVSRVAMFTNATALYVFYFPIEMVNWLGYVVNSIVVLGLVGGIARLFRTKIPYLYKFGWIASSIVVAGLMIYGLTL